MEENLETTTNKVHKLIVIETAKNITESEKLNLKTNQQTSSKYILLNQLEDENIKKEDSIIIETYKYSNNKTPKQLIKNLIKSKYEKNNEIYSERIVNLEKENKNSKKNLKKTNFLNLHNPFEKKDTFKKDKTTHKKYIAILDLGTIAMPIYSIVEYMNNSGWNKEAIAGTITGITITGMELVIEKLRRDIKKTNQFYYEHSSEYLKKNNAKLENNTKIITKINNAEYTYHYVKDAKEFLDNLESKKIIGVEYNNEDIESTLKQIYSNYKPFK